MTLKFSIWEADMLELVLFVGQFQGAVSSFQSVNNINIHTLLMLTMCFIWSFELFRDRESTNKKKPYWNFI